MAPDVTKSLCWPIRPSCSTCPGDNTVLVLEEAQEQEQEREEQEQEREEQEQEQEEAHDPFRMESFTPSLQQGSQEVSPMAEILLLWRWISLRKRE